MKFIISGVILLLFYCSETLSNETSNKDKNVLLIYF